MSYPTCIVNSYYSYSLMLLLLLSTANDKIWAWPKESSWKIKIPYADHMSWLQGKQMNIWRDLQLLLLPCHSGLFCCWYGSPWRLPLHQVLHRVPDPCSCCSPSIWVWKLHSNEVLTSQTITQKQWLLNIKVMTKDNHHLQMSANVQHSCEIL